jgi:hypothetical protein
VELLREPRQGMFMSLQVLLDQWLEVNYGQLYVESFEDQDAATESAFLSQRNGLAGAHVPGFLFLVTGLRDGSVAFTAQRHSVEPPLEGGWEDIVEVSFSALTTGTAIRQWDGSRYDLDLEPGDYRVRYYARGMQRGWDLESPTDDEPVDSYLLQFWPAPHTTDRIIRQSTDVAAYFHQQHTGARPDATTAQQHLSREAVRRGSDDEVVDARLAAVSIYLGDIKALDRDLMRTLAAGDDATLRAVARWAALQALDAAGMTDLPSLSSVVTALRHATPVPAPFDDELDAPGALEDLPETTVAQIEILRDDSDADPVQQLNAILAVAATARPDSLEAALDAIVLSSITHGEERYRALLARLHKDLPAL